MATLGQMKTRLLAEINRSSAADITAVTNALLSAIRYYQGRPFWFLEVSSTLTVTDNTSDVSLPANFQQLVCLRNAYNGTDYGDGYGFDEVTFRELQNVWKQVAPTQRQFSKWALFGTKIYTDSLANGAQTLKIDYIKGDTTLPSGDSDTSVMFEEAQDMIRYRSLIMLYQDYLHDTDSPMVDRYQQEVIRWENNLTSRSNTRMQTMRIM
jgi:hypothetical protein